MSVNSTRILKAFLDGKSARARNDATDGSKLFYHSSCIAKHLGEGRIRLSHCGHAKPSTMSRLNAICEQTGNGRPWRIRDFTVQFNGEPAGDFHIISTKHS